MRTAFAHLLISAAALALVSFESSAAAPGTDAKAQYQSARNSADAKYKSAREKCNSLKENEKDVCTAEARAARDRAKANAEAKYKGTPKAQVDARRVAADADYAVAKAKCNGMKGNEKDVCAKDAKAAHTSAIADAKADRKVSEAREDAREEKADAAYKAQLERCDALSGANKDDCISMVKAKFKK